MEATLVILDLPSTTTVQVSKKLVEVRKTGGAVTLGGRVLTLVVCTRDTGNAEEAIEAANEASREHPCRVIVLLRGDEQSEPRLDAQIRVGGDAGASEVVVLRLYGPLADHESSVVIPFLLPPTPPGSRVVAPLEAPEIPAKDPPVGKLAIRRITDATGAPPIRPPPSRGDSRRTPPAIPISPGVASPTGARSSRRLSISRRTRRSPQRWSPVSKPNRHWIFSPVGWQPRSTVRSFDVRVS